MFESLFILTLLETGTRVARFILAEAIGQFRPGEATHRKTTWAMNIGTSLAVCFCWGYLLYTGNIDRLWRMMGIANQLLAVIGLAVGTTYLLQHSPKRVYALCTAIPFVFVVASVFTAGVLSIGMWWHEIGTFDGQVTCGMAAAMLALSAVTVVESVRRWYLILRTPSQAGVDAAAEAATELSGM
jgi:carbon starvation protein